MQQAYGEACWWFKCRLPAAWPVNRPFPVNEPGDGAFRGPQSELARIKASMGIESGGQEGLLREGGSCVSTGTRPGSETFWATREIIEANSQKMPTPIKESVRGSCGITVPGKSSFCEPKRCTPFFL